MAAAALAPRRRCGRGWNCAAGPTLAAAAWLLLIAVLAGPARGAWVQDAMTLPLALFQQAPPAAIAAAGTDGAAHPAAGDAAMGAAVAGACPAGEEPGPPPPRALLRFDLSPAAQQDVIKGQLRLYVRAAAPAEPPAAGSDALPAAPSPGRRLRLQMAPPGGLPTDPGPVLAEHVAEVPVPARTAGAGDWVELRVDLTNAAKRWLAGNTPNHGVLLTWELVPAAAGGGAGKAGAAAALGCWPPAGTPMLAGLTANGILAAAEAEGGGGEGSRRPLLHVSLRHAAEDAPGVALTSGPGPVEAAGVATFGFEAAPTPGALTASKFECAVDELAYVACSSPVRVENLPHGPHVFRVRAAAEPPPPLPAGAGDKEHAERDRLAAAAAAGGAVERHWVVDLVPPKVGISSGPPRPLAPTGEAAFEFSALDDAGTGGDAGTPAVALACGLDDAALEPCVSPVRLRGLTPGEHRFTVRAADAAGNAATAAWAWRVAQPPVVTVSLASGDAGAGRGARAPFRVRFSWSDAAPQTFSQSAVAVGGAGGAMSEWTADADRREFTALVTPARDGLVTLTLASDAAGAGGAAVGTPALSVRYDATPPACKLRGPTDAVAGEAFEVTLTCSEAMDAADSAAAAASGGLQLRGMTGASVHAGAWEPTSATPDAPAAGNAASGGSHRRVLSMVAPTAGALEIALPAGGVTDVAGNPCAAAGPMRVAIAAPEPTDDAPPQASLTLASGAAADEPQAAPFDVLISWSRRVRDFSAEGLLLGGVGGRVESLSPAGADGRSFRARIKPAEAGTVTLSVPAGAARSAAGGAPNVASAAALSVAYTGGGCRAELGCQWQMARFEHEMALQRVEAEAAARAEQETASIRQRAAADLARLEAETAAAERRALIERKTARERAEAEAAGRIREALETEEVALRAIAARGAAQRVALLEAVGAVLSFLAVGATTLLTDHTKLQTALAAAAALALAFFAAREAARVAREQLTRILGQPSLVRETSRGLFTGLLWRLKRGSAANMLGHVVLEEGLHERLRGLAGSVASARGRGAPFRHLLLYGPPGTGKTMAAEMLARTAGIDYALMSGGDVAPLGAAAVTELHKLFDWARRSRRGLLLFIDEADAFLRRRDVGGLSEATRAALNAVLYRTGSQANTALMLVLASNRPEDLDTAVLDRLDDMLEFGLPGLQQREAILRLNLRESLPPAVPLWARLARGLHAVDLSGLDEAKTLAEAARRTDGFSGRELAKLVAGVQAFVYGREGGALRLTADDFRTVCTFKLAEHKRRAAIQARGDALARGPAGALVSPGGGGVSPMPLLADLSSGGTRLLDARAKAAAAAPANGAGE